jgi:hypothetical protein
MGHPRRLAWPYSSLVLLRRFLAGFVAVFGLGVVLLSGASDSGTGAPSPYIPPGSGHHPGEPTAAAPHDGSGVPTTVVIIAIAVALFAAALVLRRLVRRRGSPTSLGSLPTPASQRREIPYSLQVGSTALGMLSALATVVQAFKS